MIDIVSATNLPGRWLAHSLWQGAAVLLVYLLLERMMRRDDAESECRAASVGLVLIAVLPLLTAIASLLAASLTPAAQATQGSAGNVLPMPGEVLRLMQRHMTLDAARWLVGVWLAGVSLSLAHLLLGVWRLHRRLRAESRIISLPGLGGLAARLGLERLPQVREWPRARSPFVTGWRRPVLVVPPQLHRLLGASEAESVLLHELAHVARQDVGRHLLLRLLGALAWHQLPFRVLLRDLNRARERSCDDLAVHAMGERLPLARALVLLEQRRGAGPRLAMAGTGGDFSSRVRRILAVAEPGRARLRLAPELVLASVMLVSGATLLAAAAAEGTLSRWASSVHAMISAHDPAGPFTVELLGSRLVSATIDGQPVPAERILQQGSRVALLDAEGRPELTLRVESPAAIHWTPRPHPSP